jgi:mannose/fructose/N-acetylgalactosamine-specific phosphotransferase system component IIB
MGDSVRFATSYKIILVVGPTSASANTVTEGYVLEIRQVNATSCAKENGKGEITKASRAGLVSHIY